MVEKPPVVPIVVNLSSKIALWWFTNQNIDKDIPTWDSPQDNLTIIISPDFENDNVTQEA